MNHRRLYYAIVGWWLAAGCAVLPLRAQIQLPEKTRQQIAELLEDKENRTPAQKKLESRLIYANRMAQGLPLTRSLASLPRIAGSLPMRENTVQVDIDGAVGPPLLAAIRDVGGRVESSLPEYRRIRAWVPLAAAERLAQRDDVYSIRLPTPAITASERRAAPRRPAPGVLFSPRPQPGAPIDTGGIIAHGVNLVTQTGAGIKIAAMSNGIGGMAAMQAAGQLPANITVVPGQAGLASNNEGSALLQIIYNLAPSASLYFAVAIDSDAQFAANIRTLVDTYHVDIIVDDSELSADPAFQDGIVSQAVNYAFSQGVLYYSAAENDNNLDSDVSGTWEGDFNDSGQTISLPSPINKSYHYHLFQTGTTYLQLGNQAGDTSVKPVWIVLQWADPWGSSCNDYDFFMTSSSGNLIDLSTNVQNCFASNPFEIVPYTNDQHQLPAAGDLIWIVKTNAAATVAMHLNSGRGVLFNPLDGTNAGSNGAMYGHNSTPGAMGVGAVGVYTTNNNTPGGGNIFTGGAQNFVEVISSDGPRHIFFNPDSTPITPNAFTFASGGGTVRSKPDILAADGGQSTAVGYAPYFYGTSASAPHAAAIAALVKSADSFLTAADVNAVLKGTALTVTANPTQPQGVAVRTQGSGIIMANLAIASLHPAITVSAGALTPNVTIAGSNCGAGTFALPITQNMTAAAPCTFSAPASIAGPAGTRYLFTGWSDGDTTNPRSLTVPLTPTTFTATYQTQYLLTLSASNGTLTGAPASPGGDGYYNSGTSVLLTATPASGYNFTGFSGSVTSGTNPLSVVMSAPRSVTANFFQGSPCDLQHTGSVTVADVQTMVNEALGAASAANDLNSDGVVNILDVQIEINAALGLGCIV